MELATIESYHMLIGVDIPVNPDTVIIKLVFLLLIEFLYHFLQFSFSLIRDFRKYDNLESQSGQPPFYFLIQPV